MEKRRKENIKEINSEVDLDGRSVGRGNSAAGLLGREEESGPMQWRKRGTASQDQAIYVGTLENRDIVCKFASRLEMVNGYG